MELLQNLKNTKVHPIESEEREKENTMSRNSLKGILLQRGGKNQGNIMRNGVERLFFKNLYLYKTL